MKYKVPANQIYAEIMKWRNKSQKLTSSSMTMNDLLGKAKYRVYGQLIATKLTLIKTNLICPSGRHITVTSFDINAQIFDLLSDNNLMQVDNLVFEDGNIENPFLCKRT